MTPCRGEVGDVPDSSSHGIFLSYRREDASPHARSLVLLLNQRIPDARVFMDLDSIEAGVDFAEVIEQAVESTAVLVALIGPKWATLTDEEGDRRLDNPDDFVRSEVRTALERGVRVIPVLVDGARPLRRQDLPDELHKLARLNAHKLNYDRYQYDTDQLLDLIQRVLAAINQQEEAERKAQEEAERKAQEEAERKAQEEAERKAQEEAERKAQEEAERKAQEEAERKAQEEAERKARQEGQRKARQEAQRKARQEEAERKAQEEAERKAQEEAERKAQEEAERKARQEAQRKARQKAQRGVESQAPASLSRDDVKALVRQNGMESWYKCSLCGASVKGKKLLRHLDDQHSSYRMYKVSVEGRAPRGAFKGSIAKPGIWQLELMAKEGAKAIFRLSSGSQSHQITIQAPYFKSDTIEVDGELIAQKVNLSGETYPLRRLSSSIGSDVTISMNAPSGHRSLSVTLKIGDQVLQASVRPK
jgi:TIR domain